MSEYGKDRNIAKNVLNQQYVQKHGNKNLEKLVIFNYLVLKNILGSIIRIYYQSSLYRMIIDLTQNLKNQLNYYPQVAQTYSPPKISPNVKLYSTYSEDIYQTLIKISGILAQNKENYFSNASYSFEAFTDNQREQLNTNIRNNLQSVLNQINQLSEGLKKQTNFNRITQKQHLKAVVLCLYQLFKQTERTYAQFQEFSLKRKQKIEKTIAFDKLEQKGKYQTPIVKPRKSQITDQQLIKQSGMLIVAKIAKQNSIQQNMKKIESIHELMSSMSNIVLEQQLKTSGFLQIGQTGLFHIQKGNKNLLEANMLAKATGKWWSLLFLSMAFSLLILDFLKS